MLRTAARREAPTASDFGLGLSVCGNGPIGFKIYISRFIQLYGYYTEFRGVFDYERGRHASLGYKSVPRSKSSSLCGFSAHVDSIGVWLAWHVCRTLSAKAHSHLGLVQGKLLNSLAPFRAIIVARHILLETCQKGRNSTILNVETPKKNLFPKAIHKPAA